ncbi:delta-aminolevulinic acid dehydratase [Priestia endophytica]|uniref:Delta-aminolevulinic acid dehydratase n=1 Tax=Priestia endophytica TaxID=135735 RepID=A0AAX1Q6C5_9BACI|nr:delta-aminolevulinic acid dehydratase [Priestia endophytica]RAS75545.1 delta-aminolevulinic acid dehydratase [Priestia endophytica]
MSKPELTITLVIGPGCDTDSFAMRLALEYFGARVHVHYIGRPSDLMNVLSGEDRAADTDYLILNFHGDEGRFCMPELDSSIYEEGEPQGEFFEDKHITQYANLKGLHVIASGCTLGAEPLAKAFLENGCHSYIAPVDYIDGNANLMFVIKFFYEIISNKRNQKESFQIAKSIDQETNMYKRFTSK